LNHVSSSLSPFDKIGSKDSLNASKGPYRAGYTFQAEITVSGNPSNYTVVQSIYSTLLTRNASGAVIEQESGYNTHDGPDEGMIWRGNQRNKNIITYSDSPSFGQTSNNRISTGYYVINGETSAAGDNENCATKWSLIIFVKDGKVTVSQFNNGSYITRFSTVNGSYSLQK
jgi:hypothetical protein